MEQILCAVADPGFPVGGGEGRRAIMGCQPLMQVLFGENVCKNKELDPVGGRGLARAGGVPSGSANDVDGHYFIFTVRILVNPCELQQLCLV